MERKLGRYLLSATIAVPALLAGGLLGSGIAIATESNSVTYSACLSTLGGALYNVTSQGTPHCLGKDKVITWNQTGPQGPQGPTGASTNGVFTAVDNGTNISLSTSLTQSESSPLQSSTNALGEIAGIVVDVGPVSSLTAESIRFSGSSQVPYQIGQVTEDIWIATGPEADTPDIYPSSSIDFCVGVGQDYVSGQPTEFALSGNCLGEAGETLTISQLAAAFLSSFHLEAYAWVGITLDSIIGPGMGLLGTVTAVGNWTMSATMAMPPGGSFGITYVDVTSLTHQVPTV